MVVTLHDLTFEHHREWFRPSVAAAFRAQARLAARRSRVILTPSAHVRDDIVATYRADPAKIVVAPNAVDPGFGPDRAGTASLPAGVRAPYVVALGGAPRRNADVAIHAWRLMADAFPEHSLVVVGAGAQVDVPRVHPVGRLDDRAWAALLAGASAFVYPTGYEGFGLPALEALASGTPVVCARVGALPEVVGDAAAWSAGLRPDDIAAALAGILGDPGHSDRLRAAGLARAAAAPTWRDSAEAHLDAYRRALAD
jgi:alpha-1,3-rhamnosyl/mannosyltransferase